MKHNRCSLLCLVTVAATIISILLPSTGRAASLTALQIPVPDDGRTLQLNAWFSKPPGNGPFATVIVAHGCNGVVGTGSDWEGSNRWADWLNQSGYAALILDSFTARGLKMVCGHGMTLPIGRRATDIFAAALYISKLPAVNPKKIGALGFSHGGSTVLRAAADRDVLDPPQRAARGALAASPARLVAVVAMYPGCRGDIDSNFSSAVLILIGTGDDWTSPEECKRLFDYRRTTRTPVQLKLYPNATHAFDAPRSARVSRTGHYLKYDPAATTDAKIQIKKFLDRYLTGVDSPG